jgi:predicted metalloendopeptidase
MGEILADNSGINQAERAWHALSQGNNLLLSGLEGMTPQQLFFTSYARCFCNSIRPEAAVNRIHTDAHPPMVHRINGALQNSPGFSQAFNCPANSGMNPVKKCKLW